MYPDTFVNRIHRLGFLLALIFMLPIGNAVGQVVGEVLPPWTPGTLDIHHISTGRGDAGFFIFPDGTSMVFDVGELSDVVPAWRVPRFVSPRPDTLRTAGEYVVRYIQRRLEMQESPQIDYAMLSHFHQDHMGGIRSTSKASEKGPYKLTGITTLGDHLPIRVMLDRAWPDYEYPRPLQSIDMQNYRAFLDWHIEHGTMEVKRFKPGRHDQITLVHDKEAYPTFRVQNISANGEVWTGVEQETRHHFPKLEHLDSEDYPTENISSIVFRVSYGAFDYYTGGDIYGIPPIGKPTWHDIETPVGQAVGPVEVAVLNHHGYVDSQNINFVRLVRPQVWVIQVWDSAHPTAMVYQRLQSTELYPGPRDIFATQMHPSNKEVVVGLDRLSSDNGHVVIRVAPDGDSYRVIVVDDSTEEDRVLSVHGPYEAR